MFQAAEPGGTAASGVCDLAVGSSLSYPSKMILTSKAWHMERFLDMIVKDNLLVYYW